MDGGIEPDRIAFFAFTKKAATEAITRAKSRFGLSSADLPWFRTMHSAAFKMLGLTKTDVMQDGDYEHLSQILGSFTFEHQYDESVERVPRGGALGDRCMALYSIARAKGIPVEEAWRMSPSIDVSLSNARRFASAMDQYKKNQHLMDFSDFLDNVHTPLDIDFLVVDEAQDLTSQQWAFIRRVGANAKTIYIAGDDDQAIFQWAGADIRTFLSLSGNLITLPNSYRLPKSVYDVAVGQSSRIRLRRQKKFLPKEDPGLVEYLSSPDQVDLKDGKTWMMLGRSKHAVNSFVDICRGQGVVYFHKGQWSNQAASVRAAVDYESIRSGNFLDRRSIKNVLRYCPGADILSPETTQFQWNDIAWPFGDGAPWYDALVALGSEEREYIRRLRRDSESLRDPGRVVLSTIHGAKGGEADNVLLSTDTTKKISISAELDPDQEYRVWYVALSRAKEKLCICQPQTRTFYPI